MGKKSRKKSSKKGSKDHKAKQRERREKQEEQYIDSNNCGNHDYNNNCHEGIMETGSSLNVATILEGDRVWVLSRFKAYFVNDANQDNPDLRRGVVRKLGDDGIAHVQLLASLRIGDETTKPFPVDDLCRDCLNLTSKFQVGDQVVCNTALGGRLPGVVTHLWPIWEFKRSLHSVNVCNFPIYQVMIDPSVRSKGCPGKVPGLFNIYAPSEDEQHIMKRTTKTRFGVGDRVLINMKKTDEFHPFSKKDLELAFPDDDWIHATISAVDVFGPLDEQYGVYKCAIELNGQTVFGFIQKDNDEHIALVASDPRERLFNAIEEGCSSEHIDYIIETFLIDASLIKELLVSKAIEFGSFDMCCWLERSGTVDLACLSFPGGNNILHEISRSSHSFRFIEKFADYTSKYHLEDFSLVEVCGEEQAPIRRRNDDGKTWLHILCDRGDLRSIDRALHPQNGLFWVLLQQEDAFEDLGSGEYQTSNNIVLFQDREIIRFAFECFLSDSKIRNQLSKIMCNGVQEKVMQNFSAEKIIRFTRQWEEFHPILTSGNLEEIIQRLVTHGHSKLFKQLLDADESILHFTYSSNSSTCINLCVQPELYKQEDKESRNSREIDIVGLAIEGEAHLIPKYSRYELRSYIEFLVSGVCRELLEEPEGFPLFSMLENYPRKNEIIMYQIGNLVDSMTLPGRIQILDILTSYPQVRLPNALEAVKARQCGLLYWMVHRSFVNLDSKASVDRQLQTMSVRNLECLGPCRCIPDLISTGTLLSFACVEYDSLHALAWLSKDQHVSLSGSIDGFTFLHTCAYFGRLEIILWFYTRPEWKETASEFSTRKGFEHSTAVHVAVIKNHTNAADLLLKLGCPSLDGKERSSGILALKSEHEFVRTWGEKILKPLRLEEDIRKFMKFLAKKKYDAAKRFASSSACLALDRWANVGIYHASTASLPSGETYENIISKCINDHMHNEDFVLWLCDFVTRPLGTRSENTWQQTRFWARSSDDDVKYLDVRTLLEFVHQHADEDLAKLFTDPSVHGIRVVNSSAWLPQNTPAIVRQRLVIRLIYEKVLDILLGKARSIIMKGDNTALLQSVAMNYRQAAKIVAGENQESLVRYFSHNLFILEGERYINMDAFFEVYRDDDSSWENSLPQSLSRRDLEKLYSFIAIENYYNILSWCVDHGEGWSAQMESDMIRIAAYHGHDRIVSFFLHSNDISKWFAPHAELQKSAIFGAAEAGRETYWKGLIKRYGLPSDQLPSLIEQNSLRRDDEIETHIKNVEQLELLFSSHAVVIVYSHLLTNDLEKRATYEAMISLLLEDERYRPIHLVKIAEALLNTLEEDEFYQLSIFSLRSFINLCCVTSGGFHHRQDHVTQEALYNISQDVLKWSLRLKWDKKDKDKVFDEITMWMTAAMKWGVDLQYLHTEYPEIRNLILKLQSEQRLQWAKLDIIKNGQPLSAIKAAVYNEGIALEKTDCNGLSLIHLASAYDRTDVLGWLWENENVDVNQKDDLGRTPLEVARASKAPSATKWIEERLAMEILARFFRKNVRRRLAYIHQLRLALAASKIQAIQRGRTARKLFRGTLLLRVDESLRFQGIWERNLTTMRDIGPERHTWSSTRRLNENRLSQIDDLDEIMKTSEKLEAASASAMSDESADDYAETDPSNEHVESDVVDRAGSQCATLCEITTETKILFTDYVMKWLRQADAKYRVFFVRRLQQLQRGERSRILAKRLKGSQSTIFETYLEQKSGHRILWRNEEIGTILIWFVAKHKNVSKLMQLIDDSESRSARQRISLADALPETALNTSSVETGSQQHRVLLNPLGNVPLKVFEFGTMGMEGMKNDAWSPRLYLTEQERDIIESNGTVLLLGRSGTGKTICICNRMDLDAQRFQHNDGFKQMFVARSQRLCRYVSETVVFEAPDNSFIVFSRLIDNLERCLPKLDSTRDLFLPSQKMDFARFKREIYSGASRKSELHIDPLLVWTSIRTFCKGSIEALQEPQRVLGRDTFLDLGERRCRLGKAHREFVYDIFLRYQKICSERNLWDDCDRITSIILRLQEARGNDLPAFQRVHRSKIYVDEIQDYTQAEICIFFLLSGPGDLFMAGDPAQSVVEGVEFRFEDIRSVAYHMSNRGSRDLVPQKPKVVTVNFRSHSGVLDTAAAILRCMFDAFPYSAKQLAEDRGLFHGPRPGVFHRVQVDRLRSLISEKLNGVVVLTHDSSVRYWKRALGDYQLVYGIRAAKGLEFKSVIILDFFSEIPREFQRPWRNLLLGRTQDSPKPELEGHLKLLYTAVTRCIEQLFFAETEASSAGDAFVRWITTVTIRPSALATRQNVDEVEKMTLTQDEWVASGLDNAEMAESTEETNLEESLFLLEKALYCFEQGKDAKLSQKARTHRSALLFRQNLFVRGKDISSSNDVPDGSVEVRAAELMGQLLLEGSLLAALRVVKFSLPYFGNYSREKLENIILPKVLAIEQ